MIKRMEADLERLSQDRPGKGRIAAYYQRRGYLTGTGTLIDEIMERAGLVNLAERLGRPALSRLSLEEMARSRPDFLLMESATRRVNDRGSERSEEHTSELQSLMRISYAVFCLKKKTQHI